MTERLDLNSLRLYYDVVNAGSITRAAEQLRMPKSTISRKLALLEQHLGAILLKKGPKRLSTTDMGTTSCSLPLPQDIPSHDFPRHALTGAAASFSCWRK